VDVGDSSGDAVVDVAPGGLDVEIAGSVVAGTVVEVVVIVVVTDGSVTSIVTVAVARLTNCDVTRSKDMWS
jgi:hypothetical protein